MTSLDQGIEDVTRTVWATVLELPVIRSSAPLPPAEPTVTGFVQIEGAFEGAVMLRCPETLAVLLTAAMLDTADDPDPADVRDALGEITNMLAGNVKALLPQPCRITLPVVAYGRDYQVNVLRTRPVAEVSFTCRGEAFLVILLQQSDV